MVTYSQLSLLEDVIMPLFIAKLLVPVDHRLDWRQPRLNYVPRPLYRRVIRSIRTFTQA